MADLKTIATDGSVDRFIDGVADPQRQSDARQLRDLLQRLTGEPAQMWGSSIIGFGFYHYRYDSGREGTMARIGFSPRAKELVLYLVGGFDRHQDALANLGKVRTGKGCLNIKRLADVDQAVLEQLLHDELAYMDHKYPRG